MFQRPQCNPSPDLLPPETGQDGAFLYREVPEIIGGFFLRTGAAIHLINSDITEDFLIIIQITKHISNTNKEKIKVAG